jgi:hypothetical protein
MKKIMLTFALFTVSALTPLAQEAHAWVRVGIGIGVPLYVGPGPYYYGYPYYYPPTYVVPGPAVVYQTAPPATPVPAAPVPAPAPAPQRSEAVAPPQAYAAPAPVTPGANPLVAPVANNVIPVSIQSSPEIDALVKQLSQPSDTGRRDVALQLGRMKAESAVNPLVNMLQKDTSPIARDGAARSLGLIASPTSLKALIYAAQADDDREVRRSAQFAVEVIRSNLRGN